MSEIDFEIIDTKIDCGDIYDMLEKFQAELTGRDQSETYNWYIKHMRKALADRDAVIAEHKPIADKLHRANQRIEL
jgi:hypothetical protein